MSKTSEPRQSPSNSTDARRSRWGSIGLLAGLAFALVAVFAPATANAAPTDELAPAPGIFSTLRAELVDVECPGDNVFVTMKFINDSPSPATFRYNRTAGDAVNTEAIVVAANDSVVDTRDLWDDVLIRVNIEFTKNIFSQVITCPLTLVAVPTVNPGVLSPVDPGDAPLPPLLLPSTGTGAAVVDVICGNEVTNDQAMIQLTNDNGTARDFAVTRGTDGSVDLAEFTVGANGARAEFIDIADGDHVTVHVGVVAILDETLTIDCAFNPVPLTPPIDPGQVTPVPLLPIPEETDPTENGPTDADDATLAGAPAVDQSATTAPESSAPAAGQTQAVNSTGNVATTDATPAATTPILVLVIAAGSLVLAAAALGLVVGRGQK